MDAKKGTRRLETLRAILTEKDVASQEAIMEELARAGYKMTQATLSRDLHTLHATKVVGSTGYTYILPDHPLYRRILSPTINSRQTNGNSGFIRMNFSGQMAVIHTRPGYATLLASEIDDHELQTVEGTVAGDDTIIVVLQEQADRKQFIEELAEIVPVVKQIKV